LLDGFLYQNITEKARNLSGSFADGNFLYHVVTCCVL